MAFDVINNGESGAVVRGKLNDNFSAAVETTDPRLGSVDYPSLPDAGALLASDVVALSRAGVGLKTTAGALAGDPMQTQKGIALNRSQWFTQFERIPEALVVADGEFVGQEPYIYKKSGAGANISNGFATYFVSCLKLIVTAAAEYSILRHASFPYLFAPGVTDLDSRWAVILPILPNGTNNFEVEVGFTTADAPCTQGTFFSLTNGDTNWQMRVRNAGGTETVDSGVAATTGANTFRNLINAANTESQFILNGVALPPIDDSTRVIGTFAFLGMTVSIRKIAGPAAREIVVFAHRGNNAKDAPAHFA